MSATRRSLPPAQFGAVSSLALRRCLTIKWSSEGNQTRFLGPKWREAQLASSRGARRRTGNQGTGNSPQRGSRGCLPLEIGNRGSGITDGRP